MSTGVFPLLFLVGFLGQPWQRDLRLQGAAGRVGSAGGPEKGIRGASPSPSARAGSGGARLGLAMSRGAEAGLAHPEGRMAAASGLRWPR